MKVSKASADYGQGGDVCGSCKFFVEDESMEEEEEEEYGELGTCEKVEGVIGELMWCKLFERGHHEEEEEEDSPYSRGSTSPLGGKARNA